MRMKRSIRNGIVPPACDQMIRMSGQRCDVPLNTMLTMARVVSVPYSIIESWITISFRIACSNRPQRMGVDHRLAPVELFEDRREDLVAEPFVVIARDRCDAVGFQHIESVFDLFQRAVDIGQRQRGEHAESAGMIRTSFAA